MRGQLVLANFFLQVLSCSTAALLGQNGSNYNVTIPVAPKMLKPQRPVQHNFLVGIASLGASDENKTQCGRELEMLLSAIENRENWGLKVVDYFGAPPSTFTWGNFFWFKTPDLCEELNRPSAISLGRTRAAPFFNATSPMAMQFVVVYLNFTTPFYIDMKLPFETLIHLGLCLPKSCDSMYVSRLTNEYFQNGNFQMQKTFQLQMKAVEFFCLSIFLPLLAELLHKSKHKLHHQHALHAKAHSDVLSPLSAMPYTTLPNNSMWEKLLLCFRLGDNYGDVMILDNSNRNSTFLTMMTGMRSIICLWITVFHVYYYSLFAMSNTPYIFAKLEQLALQPVLQACFYVDVFFVMSSFLLVYNFLSNTKRMQRIESASVWDCMKMFFKSLLQRYMRLTPVMIVTMLLGTMTMDFLNMYTPFRLGEHSGLYCKGNWWYNLLYIQNFLDMNCICCSWTWYLACEMQYFILLTALLFLHVRHPKLGKIAFAIMTMGFVAIAWWCNYVNGISFEIDVIFSTLNQLYVKPWVRIIPYLGGALMGWCMHTIQPRCQQQQPQDLTAPPNLNPLTQQLPNLSKGTKWSKIFWLLSLMFYIVTNFMSYWRSTPTWAVATIMSVGKLLFSLWIGGVIVLCARGYGGQLNALLSLGIFQFLNKFCYSIYMLAPVIVFVMFGLRQQATDFTEVGSGADFLAICALAIAAAMPLYLLVELPMQKLCKILLG